MVKSLLGRTLCGEVDIRHRSLTEITKQNYKEPNHCVTEIYDEPGNKRPRSVCFASSKDAECFKCK